MAVDSGRATFNSGGSSEPSQPLKLFYRRVHSLLFCAFYQIEPRLYVIVPFDPSKWIWANYKIICTYNLNFTTHEVCYRSKNCISSVNKFDDFCYENKLSLGSVDNF